MLKYNNPFLLLILFGMLGSCNNSFVEQKEIKPEIGSKYRIFEGKFGLLDLLHIDSVPNPSSPPIELFTEVSNNDISFESLIPADSVYTRSIDLFQAVSNFRVSDHASVNQSIDQLQFIQFFSPGDFSLFNTNNGNSITWNGCNNFSNNLFFAPINAPQIYGDAHIDSASYQIVLVNNFDFDVTLVLSLKSNPDIIWSGNVTLASNETKTISTTVTNKDVNASYNWAITGVSSPGINSGSGTTLDNSNRLEFFVSRSKAYVSSGKFRPQNTILVDLISDLPLPIENADDFYLVQGESIDFGNSISASGLKSTSLKLYRTITDSTGLLYSDDINIISAIPSGINWNTTLSNRPIHPIDGTLKVHYQLVATPSGIVDFESNKSVLVNEGFANPPNISALGLNEDWSVVRSSKIIPLPQLPPEFELAFVPEKSSLLSLFECYGWGDLVVETKYSNHIGTNFTDERNLSLGKNSSEMNNNVSHKWSLIEPGSNIANAMVPDSIVSTQTFIFKAPWGFKSGEIAHSSINSTSRFSSNQGKAQLSVEKYLRLNQNPLFDSLFMASDSVSIHTALRSKMKNSLITNFSITHTSDTVLSVNKQHLAHGDEYISEKQNISNIPIATLFKLNFDAVFNSPTIDLYTGDSLFLDLYLNFNGLP